MAWEDVIIYIPDQDKSLRAYEWKVNGLRLRVTRHICDPDKWFISFRPFYDLKEIGNVGDDIEKLKEKALDEARSQLNYWLSARRYEVYLAAEGGKEKEDVTN